MKLDWAKLKEFAALPAGKQILIGLILLLTSSWSLNGWLGVKVLRSETEKQNLVDSAGRDKLRLQKECSDTLTATLKRFEQEKAVMYIAAIRKLEDKERDLDAALAEQRQIVLTQKRTGAKLQRITSNVSKLVTDGK